MSLQFSRWGFVANYLEAYDLLITYVIFGLILGLPVFIPVFFTWNWKKLETDEVIEEEELR